MHYKEIVQTSKKSQKMSNTLDVSRMAAQNH